MSNSKTPEPSCHGVAVRARRALDILIQSSLSELPQSVIKHATNVEFLPGSTGDMVCFPCPLQEQEAGSALKALEGGAIAAIAELIEDKREPGRSSVKVHLERVTCFLMSAYMVTINDRGKQHPGIKELVRDTDFNKAQSVMYRRLSANLYKTAEDDKYYHIHGSLDASTTLSMLGLPTHSPDMDKYEDCLKTIGGAVAKLTTAELEEINAKHRQAGAPALTKEEFLNTSHGKVLQSLPPFTVGRMEGSVQTPPVAFPAAASLPLPSTPEDKPRRPKQILEGIKVLELCRVIAGPTIGRSLAALGASVLRINSPKLPDVTFFQVDANTGKHAAFLDLTDPDQRIAFDSLLQEADVVIDGYRPGVLAKFGCEPQALARRAAQRGRGYVYVVEDCFGGTGSLKRNLGGNGDGDGDGDEDGNRIGDDAEWAHRPGWQQIADCVSGVAWEQGRFMGLSEPVVPPFPMSDYGTGCLGSAAALVGLLRRARDGGSWACRTSLLQYDLFLLSLGRHAPEVEAALRAAHDAEFFELRHDDSVDVVSAAALKSMRRLHPLLFDRGVMMHSAASDGFPMPKPLPKADSDDGDAAAAAEGQAVAENRNTNTTVTVNWPREAVEVEGWKIGHVRPSRANGNDEPRWGDWERDEALLDA